MARGIRGNGAYRDPNIAVIENNLAKLFAPPSGADAYGWAKANAETAQAARLADLYRVATDPNSTQARMDGYGLGAGVWNPRNSFATVNLEDATRRRGDDLVYNASRENNTADNSTRRFGYTTQADAARYGHDRNFAASRLNNVDDNAGRLTVAGIQDATRRRGDDLTYFASRENNTDDNARALTVEGIQDATRRRGNDLTYFASRENTADEVAGRMAVSNADNAAKLALERAQPTILGQGQTAYFPPTEAATRGLPGTLAGLMSAGQGETLFTPGGQTLRGAAKPLSMTEWEAQQAEKLRAGGQLTPEMLLDTIAGKQTPVQAVGPDGAPRFMSPGAAVRTGAAPYDKPTAGAAPKLGLARLPDGSTVTARYDAGTQRLVHAQTGQVLPDTAIMSNLPTPTGSFNDAAPAPTTANKTTANVMRADDTITLGMIDDYEKMIRGNPGVTGMVGYIRGTAQNAVQSAADLAAAFGGNSGVSQAAAATKEGLRSIAPELFDPALPEAEFMRGALAYRLAKTENPGAEVSRHAYDRAYGRIGGGALANQASTLAQIDAIRNLVRRRMEGTQALDNPAAARTDPNFQQPPAAIRGPMVIPTQNGNVTIRRKDAP